jgi:hypothetical protein
VELDVIDKLLIGYSALVGYSKIMGMQWDSTSAIHRLQEGLVLSQEKRSVHHYH